MAEVHTLQEILAEMRVMRMAMERLESVLSAEAKARMAWDERQRQLAASLMGDSDVFSDSVGADSPPVPNAAYNEQTGQEGPLIAATEGATHMAGEQQRQNATPAAIPLKKDFTPQALEELYKTIENDWFIGKDEAHYLRGKDGQPDRRANPQEDAAIRHDQSKGRKRRR